jgi:pimeloyl-ACP methyl ester carboxylesterase
VLVGAPIVGSSLNPFLKLAGYGWIAKLVWRIPLIRSAIMHLILAGDSTRVKDMIFRDVTRTNLDSFFRSIGDLRDTDLREDLSRLRVPTLGIYGRLDNIVSPENADILNGGSMQASSSIFDHSRHFPMADEPAAFVDALAGFLQPQFSG